MKNLKIWAFFLLGILAGLTAIFFVRDFNWFRPVFEAGLVGFVAALVSFFLDFCFREGNVLSFWIRFLNKYFHKNAKNPFRFLYKPLGACTICMNVYVANLVFVVYWYFWDLSFIWLIPSALIAHVVLYFMLKHFDIEQ